MSEPTIEIIRQSPSRMCRYRIQQAGGGPIYGVGRARYADTLWGARWKARKMAKELTLHKERTGVVETYRPGEKKRRTSLSWFKR